MKGFRQEGEGPVAEERRAGLLRIMERVRERGGTGDDMGERSAQLGTGIFPRQDELS